MPKTNSIEVTSHVSRDFLQNSAYFNTMSKLIWEYVANSLDASSENEISVIFVEITSNFVTISDNGRGMSRNELGNFFQMHGENILRKHEHVDFIVRGEGEITLVHLLNEIENNSKG